MNCGSEVDLGEILLSIQLFPDTLLISSEYRKFAKNFNID